MSFFSSLFGGDAKRYAREASAQAQQNLTTGFNQARDALTSGQGQARESLTKGYDSARTDILGGYSNARSTLTDYAGRARTDLNTGYDAAAGNVRDYGQRGIDALNPYVQSGYGNQALIDRLNGVSGTGDQSTGYQAYQDLYGPIVAARDAKLNADMERMANARGSLNSGRTSLALARAGQERAAQDFQTYLNNLNTSAARGASAASQVAGINQSTGSQLADIEARRGTGLSSINAGLGDTLSRYDIGQATDTARLSTGLADRTADLSTSYNNNLANLTSQYYNALAGNNINLGSAQAQAAAQGANSTIGLIGATIGAFTPGRFGISPFQSALGALTNNQLSGQSTPGTAINGGWSTTTRPASWFE